MLPCPRCSVAMQRRFLKRGVTWMCPTCEGRTATEPMLRRVLGKRVVEGLWRSPDVASARVGIPCPSCLKTMREVEVRTPDGAQTLDTCRTCHFIWFDPGEYHAMPRETDSRWPASHAKARRREETIERGKGVKPWRREEARHPDEGWKWLPGLLGMPVEFKSRPLRSKPWTTWILLSLISAIGIVTFQNLQPIVDRYGFLPADPWRMGGLTTITAFFLHGGWFHLVGNAYFLWVFGDNTEDALGIPRYLLLILLATLVGNLAHWATTPTPEIPCVGASGGISGVIAYYALRFPRMRLGLLFYYVFWLRMSALSCFLLWVVIQLIGASLSLGNVAYVAHLGGAAVGLLFWLLDPDRPTSTETRPRRRWRRRALRQKPSPEDAAVE